MEKKFNFKSIFKSGIFAGTYTRTVWRFIWNCSSTLFLLFMLIVIYLIVYEGIYKEWIYPNLPQEECMEWMEDAESPNTLVVFKPDPEYPEYNECGCYWTGSFSDEDCHWSALNLQFQEIDHYSTYTNPHEGLTIRPVTGK